jgi:lipopolysaccharide transport protein LptA
MKKIRVLFTIFAISVFIIIPCQLRWAAGAAAADSGASGQIIIHHSDTFVADYNKGTAVFSGGVEAEWDDITLSCRKLEVFYENSSGEKAVENIQASIKNMTATGDVIINRKADGVIATAQKVEYFKSKETMVMTGDPVLKRGGGDQMKASMITYEIKENRFSFENVEAVLTPGEKR